MRRFSARIVPRDLGSGRAPHAFAPQDMLERGVERADAMGHAGEIGMQRDRHDAARPSPTSPPALARAVSPAVAAARRIAAPPRPGPPCSGPRVLLSLSPKIPLLRPFHPSTFWGGGQPCSLFPGAVPRTP